MLNLTESSMAVSERKGLILKAAIPVFGRFGFKKTSVDDIAAAANLSKQGLYLHFSSKAEIFQAAMQKYLKDGLGLVEQELARTDISLFQRLMGAMDVWFGCHLVTFTPQSFDVIEVGDHLSGDRVEECKSAFKAKLAKALADSPEFKKADNVCTPKEISEVLFQFGLTWKEGHPSRADFMKKVGTCIRACCQIKGETRSSR
jgi:AcrR family transcriptional regulator